MYMSQMGAAQSRYRSVELTSRIEGASPHMLVMIMFEELTKSMDLMIAAMRRVDHFKKGRSQARALAILHGLETSLDFEKGGQIATSLASIYRETRRLLLEAGRTEQEDLVLRARQLLQDIASAWEAIDSKAA